MADTRCMKIRLVIGSLLAGAALTQADVRVDMKSGEPKHAESIKYDAASQDYILTQGNVQINVPVKDVAHIECPKPAALDQAAKMIAGGDVASAIPLLDKIVTDYAMLQWDVKAQELLAGAYAKKGDSARAMATYTALFKKAGAGQVSVEARVGYWNLLLTGNKLDVLAASLESTIGDGSREEAAAAQLMRGNLRKTQNKTQDALLDYLRTVTLFEDVTSVQPEALFKAAELMDALRDPRASDLRRKLVEKYPKSDYARQAGAQHP